MNITFYGTKDYPLGDYLEKYCFDAKRLCYCNREFVSSGTGKNDAIHVMKFIHGTGSIEIILKKLEKPVGTKSSSIYMWKACQKCSKVSIAYWQVSLNISLSKISHRPHLLF